MGVEVAPWERRLLDWAYAGIHSPSREACDGVQSSALEKGYRACEVITQVNSRTFFLASGLLPEGKCRAVRALYAFCRTTDDVVDQVEATGEGRSPEALETWCKQALGDCTAEGDHLVLAWRDTVTTYGIPLLYAEQLVDGVSRDLSQTRYRTFEELTAYCYGVASTVGLMAMHIVGFSGPEAIPYAVKLGVALQLTNILRDVAEDWQTGRLYLPQEDLVAFGLTESDIEAGRVDDRWRAFMRFQIDRIRRLYAASLPGIQMLHRDGRFAIGAAAELYRGILDDIEAHDMDVFQRRAFVSAAGKLRRLPGIWWRATIAGYGAGYRAGSGHPRLDTRKGNE